MNAAPALRPGDEEESAVAAPRHAPACVFLMTATASPDVLAEYARIAGNLPSGWSARLLFDESAAAPPAGPLPGRLVRFDSRRFAEWGFATYGKTLIPGHTLFPFLRAAGEEQAFERFWFVEHDVRFTGDWRRFFEACATIDADFLTSHVRRQDQEPFWPLWHLAHPVEQVPLERRLRSFNTVARFSGRAMRFLRSAQGAGWTGHHEVLVPTLLHANGFSVADYGGEGPFVPRGFRNRFYTSYSTLGGELRWLGTLRYRPARRVPGRRRNSLYHPVKTVAELAAGPAAIATPSNTLWELVRYVHWRLARKRTG